jgi:hypothetical protein
MKTINKIIRLMFAAACFMMLQSGLVRAQIHQPMLQIPAIISPPVIDGNLNDAAWKNSAEQSEFIIWTLDAYVKDSLQVFLCHDGTNLYVAFRNSDMAAPGLRGTVDRKGQWDTFLWGRNFNSVQVSHQDAYFNLMADPKGTQTDYKDGDISWNGTWNYAASINQTGWTSEFSIPLAECDIAAPFGDTEFTLGLSSFSGESANWDGKCILGGPALAAYQFGRWPVPVPEKNYLPLVVRNPGKESLTLNCELELYHLNGMPEFINQAGQGPSSDLQLSVEKKPLVYRYSYSVPAGTTLQEKVMYELPWEGSYYASAVIRSADGELVRHNGDFWFTIEPNRGKLKKIQARLGESTATMTRIINPVADQLRKEAETLQEELDQLTAFAETSWNTGQWNEVTRRVTETDAAVTRFLHKVKWTALHNWKTGNDFVLHAHSAIKLRRDALFRL